MGSSSPASGAGDGVEWREGEAVELWTCGRAELGVGCPRLQFACGV